MPWTCHLHRLRPPNPVVGDMWYEPDWVLDPNSFHMRELLSEQYKNVWRKLRAPLVVVLPNRGHFCLDSAFRYNGIRDPQGRGWSVTGVEPRISVSPSINWQGDRGYHGYLHEGVLSDDLEGRRF
jgi:hypothetical protein